jgi:hypothetical protein
MKYNLIKMLIRYVNGQLFLFLEERASVKSICACMKFRLYSISEAKAQVRSHRGQLTSTLVRHNQSDCFNKCLLEVDVLVEHNCGGSSTQ